MITTVSKKQELTAGLKSPMNMTDAEWTTFSRNLHTDLGFRMLQAGDWLSVDLESGDHSYRDVCPEMTQWKTRRAADYMLVNLRGLNLENYLRESIAKLHHQFSKELDDSDTVVGLALTYGLFSDETTLFGVRWRGILTRDFGVVVRGMEHSLL